jgi:urocanate hydratase
MIACGSYIALTQGAVIAEIDASREPGLGGKLLYVRELTPVGCARVVAGNVAGCATLAATADVAAQRQSTRDGVVDFLVTSLDEALRIVKNEIRQRKTVAVCVGAAPDVVERELIERGVQPDLVFAGLRDQNLVLPAFGAGTREVQPARQEPGISFLTWKVEQALTRWMPRLDHAALDLLDANSWEHRWVSLAPRFLGRSRFAQRVLFCETSASEKILRRFGELVGSGEIDVEVSGSVTSIESSKAFRLKPGEVLQANVQDF